MKPFHRGMLRLTIVWVVYHLIILVGLYSGNRVVEGFATIIGFITTLFQAMFLIVAAVSYIMMWVENGFKST